MKQLLYILLLFSGLAYSQTYYVETGGSGTTCSIGSPCSLTYAFANASAGETWYVKAGNYGALQINSSSSGTALNPIKFIGYTTTPGDIVATTGPTYTYAQYQSNSNQLPDNVMPHLDFNTLSPSSGQDAFDITHNYIEIHNFMISDYRDGVDINSSNVTINNVIGDQFGYWVPGTPISSGWDCPNFPGSNECGGDGDNNIYQNGYGIVTSSVSNITIENCMIIDAGVVAYFFINTSNSTISNNWGVARQTGNGSDYIFDFFNGDNCTVLNNTARKEYFNNSVGHQSRGMIFQAQSDNNTVDGLTMTGLKFQLENAINNEIYNVDFTSTDPSNQTEQMGAIQIMAQSDGNLFKNISFDEVGGIEFFGYSGENQRFPHTSAGENNWFINIKKTGTTSNYNGEGAISFHRLGSTSITAGTNYFINMSVDNCYTLFNANRAGTAYIYNSSFSNMTQWSDYHPSFSDFRTSVTAIFENCNFENSSNTFGTPTDETGSLTFNGTLYNRTPDYTNDASDPPDLTLTGSASGLKDIGIDGSVENANADTDFDGSARPFNSVDDIGAYEFGGTPPSTNVTSVEVYPNADKMLVAGTRQLYQFVFPTGATDQTGAWSTSNGSVATVTSGGLVTAQGVGSCTITWTANDTANGTITDTSAITVESSSTEDSILILEPQGYYTPSSGDADSWDDTSGFELHGTEVGTITFTGSQATFDGSSYYDLPDSQFLDYSPTVDEFTVVYREGDTAPTTRGYAIAKRGITERQYGIMAYDSGNLQFYWLGGGNENASSATLNNNRLVIVIVETNQVNVWVDGINVITNSTAIGSETFTGSANIGGRTDGSYLMNNGATLDLIATIPKAISVAEREAIETEFGVNIDPVVSNSIKPTAIDGKPIYYHGTTKKYIKQN